MRYVWAGTRSGLGVGEFCGCCFDTHCCDCDELFDFWETRRNRYTDDAHCPNCSSISLDTHDESAPCRVVSRRTVKLKMPCIMDSRLPEFHNLLEAFE